MFDFEILDLLFFCKRVKLGKSLPVAGVGNQSFGKLDVGDLLMNQFFETEKFESTDSLCRQNHPDNEFFATKNNGGSFLFKLSACDSMKLSKFVLSV